MPESGGTINGQNQDSPSSEGSPSVRDVFVSRASHDAAIANAVVENLERHGIKCWIAPRDVTPGSRYADEIVGAINETKVLVLVLSEHAIASPHVGREIERAASKRRRIVGLRIDAAPLTRSFEYFLSESQWIDVAALGMPAALTKVTQAVRQGLAPSSWVSPGLGADAGNPADRRARPSYRTIKRMVAAAMFLVGAAIVVGVMVRYWPARQGGFGAPLVATISDKSVAVLPFVDMSEKKDQEYFSDGMSEELIDMLTKIPELRVPARTSSFYFKGKPTTIPDIAKALAVAYVLEGSVRKSGNVLRVTAQLIRVDTGFHLWSQTYDRQLDDVFKVQDDIARAVVSALKVSLMGKAPPESAGTQSVEAYDLYLWARSIYVQAHTRADYEKVVEYLRKALDADPKFANAWALLSTALQVQGEENYVPAAQANSEGRRAAFRSLELNPKLPDAHTALARIYIVQDLDSVRGEQQLREALQLDPNSSWALAWAATLAAHNGEFDSAIALVRKSIESDPVNPTRYGNLAAILYYARKYPEALTASRKSDDLKAGTNSSSILEGLISLATGDPGSALKLIEANPGLTGCDCRVLALDALGRKPEADLALANLERDHANDNASGIAKVYASRGDLDQAFKWFDRSYRQHEDDMLWIKVDPLVKNVQSDPRFAALLRKLGLRH
jgi:TolB-like protein/Flp pilus assembly protein TadD